MSRESPGFSRGECQGPAVVGNIHLIDAIRGSNIREIFVEAFQLKCGSINLCSVYVLPGQVLQICHDGGRGGNICGTYWMDYNGGNQCTNQEFCSGAHDFIQFFHGFLLSFSYCVK